MHIVRKKVVRAKGRPRKEAAMLDESPKSEMRFGDVLLSIIEAKSNGVSLDVIAGQYQAPREHIEHHIRVRSENIAREQIITNKRPFSPVHRVDMNFQRHGQVSKVSWQQLLTWARQYLLIRINELNNMPYLEGNPIDKPFLLYLANQVRRRQRRAIFSLIG